jgi:hypothetical protein
MRRILGIIAFILISVMAFYQLQTREVKEMSAYEPRMKSHCVGRNIVELPDGFQRAPVTTGIFKSTASTIQDPYFDVMVSENGFTSSSFSQAVNTRRSELKESSDSAVDVFEAEQKTDDGAVIFRVRKIDDAYVSEIKFLRGSSLVTVKLDSFRNEYAAAEQQLVKFASNFRENQEDSFGRSNQYFCFGSVSIFGDFKDESGSFLFKNNEGADFEVDINTYIPDASKPLLARMSGRDSLLAVFDVDHTVLRSGERNIVNMRAQEWLGWAKLSSEDGAKSFKFILETMRKEPRKAAPSISLTFNTGKPLPGGGTAKTTISENEAIQLWDRVVSSIRPATP